jgi:subtilase family serine protease
VVNSSCKGWAKPSWQSVTGNPGDGVRDLPDLSLFAANGLWGHYYVFCYTDAQGGGSPCSGAPSGWAGAGGTSFSSPILAAIQALVNQKTGETWGNPNTVYYKLAAAQYANSSLKCNSTNGNTASTGCIFHDVTQGDLDVNCSGTVNCYGSSTTETGHRVTTVYGVLSTSESSLAPAYGATTGWDFATGLGTVNAANLVNNWSTVSTGIKTK